jgi:hypothetical protein
MTWLGLCDAIFDHSQGRVWVPVEDLRQWATNFIEKGRKTPRHPNNEGFKAIAAYLTDPEIAILLPEELEDPEPPYRFLHSFLEFLRIDVNNPILEPPPRQALNGIYEAWHQVENADQAEENWVKTSLTLQLDDKSQNVRATETWEIHFRGEGETAIPSGCRPSNGWGIVTPEGSIFLVMKTQPHVHNYYYLPVEWNSRYLALLRYEPPQNRRFTRATFEEISDQMTGRTLLLKFTKKELNGGK